MRVIVVLNVLHFWPRVRFTLSPCGSTWSQRVIASKVLWVQDPVDMEMNMFNPKLPCGNSRLDYWQFISAFALLDLLLFLISLLTLIACLQRSCPSRFLSLLRFLFCWVYVAALDCTWTLRNHTLEGLPLDIMHGFLICLANFYFHLAALKIKGTFQGLFWPTRGEVGGMEVTQFRVRLMDKETEIPF